MFEPNLPNLLTVLRILLVPVVVAALLSEAEFGDLLAAGVFALASFTDALDGWIARRRQQAESTFGKLMDPLADKLLITAALVSLVSLDRLAAWVAMVIIARELAVTALRQAALARGVVTPASAWGKLKTIVQVGVIFALIAIDDSPLWLDLAVYGMVAVTVMSGIDYLLGLRRRLNGPVAGDEEIGRAPG